MRGCFHPEDTPLNLLNTTSDYNSAEPLLERALETYKNTFGEDHPEVAVPLNNLAKLYFFQVMIPKKRRIL